MAEFKIGRLKFVWRGVWTTGYDYVKDDVVRVGGSSYVCILGHTSDTAFSDDADKWDKMQEGILFKNQWQATTIYDVNDIVVYGGIAYIVTVAHTSTSSFDPSKFATLVKGFDYKNIWTISTFYRLNDLAKYGANVYLCTEQHTSGSTFDETKWDLFVPGLEFEDAWSSATVYQTGDIVTYGGYAYVSVQNHSNQVPSTATAFWELLTTGYRNEGIWDSVTTYEVGSVVQFGGNVYEAFVDNTDQQPTNTSFWKLLVQGLNFLGDWVAAQTYRPNDIVNYGSSSYRVKLVHTSGNTGALRPDLDVSGVNYGLLAEGDTNFVTLNRGDLIARGASANYNLILGEEGKVLKSNGTDPTWSYLDVVEKIYYVTPDGVDTTDRGASLDRPWASVRYACANVIGPATIFIKTGTYEEILPISVPANVSLVGDELRTVIIRPASGEQNKNMFYLRNGTNLRNITMSGLVNTLSATLPSGTSRTASAYVSLDPGTGPSDSSVWITTKSPYVQNCSTFGTAVCGMKVDGDLHNGGNQSIVANDFTQILDDGIGVWINGKGKAELVSVFTYYCYIGYLCTNGGTIRGVNGNNSYGEFGAVSEEGDPSETPKTGAVNNRNNEAIIGEVLAGGSEIIVLSIKNGGEAYTSASVTISGNGAGAIVAPVFADGAISRIDLTGRGDGHKFALNNAQTGTIASITLGVTDITPTNAYNGMRITIVDGTGAGQTAIISAYNGGTKLATVVKENGLSGWDHLVPGRDIQTVLDETSRYRIEPRVQLVGGTAPSTEAKLRAVVEAGELIRIEILDGGAGYNPSNPPAITLTDPNAVVLGTATVFIRDGAITRFNYTNRGISYTTASASVVGDGYADILQVGGFLFVDGLSAVPRGGSNIVLTGQATTFRIVAITETSGVAPNISGRIRISPFITTPPAHAATVTITEKYSNVRLTGHDFLSIGTGGVGTTNYPGLPTQDADPADEVREFAGGRVFYTSTDQDGNFRVGELFKVEQATGIATLNADAFNLSGLNELQLGSVALGGTGVTVREFSADPLLTANSDFVVPTQKAVKTFVENIIGAGGSNISATSITLGGMFLNANKIEASGENNLIFDTIASDKVVVFNKIPTTAVAPTVGTHLTNKTYTDFTYAPTIHNLTVNATTGRVVYQERHADEAVTVTQDISSADGYGFFIGQERSSVSVNAAGHLIITM